MLFSGIIFTIYSCQKATTDQFTDKIIIDSIVATKTNIGVFEKTYISAYVRGQNLKYQWKANHGSMSGIDSITVIYWACSSCVGLNTIECKVTNEFGSVSDTIMINVK
jgi:hypothetical protein